ncbi:MAG: macro domain-containing protein [Candidatus Omnitrophota bacterium]
MRIRDTEIKVVKGDITELEVGAIVNAANNQLLMGGGVAKAIKKKGGKAIEEEAVSKGPIEIGESIFTSAGNLKAKYVIHAATMGVPACRLPDGSQGKAGILQTDELKIRNSCRSSLRIAEDLKINSIAFPALGCGVGGFPLLAAAKIISQEILKHLRQKKTELKEIIICLYNQEAFEVFNRGVISYINYMTEKLQSGPFTTVDAIIEIDNGIVLVQRSNPPFGWALPGGFVDYGESLEDAVTRETKEETNLEITELKQFHTYSDPRRDPRFHTIGTVFITKVKGQPKAGDDAASLKIAKISELGKLEFAFDHKQIINDYLEYKKKAMF